MSRNNNPRSAPPRKGSSLLAGILIGMVLGLLVAGGVAWYILKTPSPFVNNVPHEAVKLAPEPPKPAPATKAAPVAEGGAASDVVADKPRFEFYKVLTDKQEAVAPAQKGEGKSAPAAAPAFLQAGSFSSADDADKLKARLALLGMEAGVQTVTLPDKGVWYRVRLGPYESADAMERARAILKQNGVDATPTRTQ
jgi:cell division protein FtsN